jgi:protocatechuate 4,5-dioxygenase beta chain
MARIVGCITTSHVPMIGKALAQELYEDSYWKPFFAGYKPLGEWLDRTRPDAAVMVYNDHGLNFFLDKMPTFAVGAAPQYVNADEGWGIPTLPPFPGHRELSWHVIESLVSDEFDITSCQEMLVDHGFTMPMALLWLRHHVPAIPVVPVMINTVQFPLPSPRRCFRLGHAIGRAIASYPGKEKVVMIGSGGLSHQLDGTRAGHINRDFDRRCMDMISEDPEALSRLTTLEIVEQAGAQGIEVVLWLTARAALTGQVATVCRQYHVPISNTATGLMALEPSA